MYFPLLFLFYQVKNAKLLERGCFFTWHIVLEVAKSQDLPSKIWQTLGDAGLFFLSPYLFGS
jgi:hypothetical protein